MSRETWQEFLSENLGKILGVSLGLILGWLIIEHGLLETLFVLALVIIGYILGKQADDGEKTGSFLDRIFKR